MWSACCWVFYLHQSSSLFKYSFFLLKLQLYKLNSLHHSSINCKKQQSKHKQVQILGTEPAFYTVTVPLISSKYKDAKRMLIYFMSLNKSICFVLPLWTCSGSVHLAVVMALTSPGHPCYDENIVAFFMVSYIFSLSF